MGRRDLSGGESPPAPKKRASTFLKVFIGLIIFIIVMAVGVGIGFVTANLNVKADLSKDILPPASSHIYDSAGNEIAIIHATENRVPVKIEQIPVNLLNAFVAIEDNRFYEHKGVDFRGLVRAAYTNLVRGEIAEGGSTITQQLAKNAYLTQERTIKRKIQEVFLALQLEKQYTKQEILELYLNQIYFGQGAYGVQAASKTYFGKNVEDLSLAECAMLAGIPKSPNYYSPFNNLEAARARGFTAVENDRPKDGVSRTIRLGLEAAGACGAAMFMVADQPMLRRRSVEKLIASYRAEPDRIAALACDGRKGNPCIFPARYFSELARLVGDQGGSAVIRKHPDALRLTEVSAEELVDLDTREEMAIWE